MRTDLPAIMQASDRLLDAIEQAVTSFPKKYRYLLGQDIRKEALQQSLLTQHAMMSGGQTKKRHLLQLRVANDRLKLLLACADHGRHIHATPAQIRTGSSQVASYFGHFRHAKAAALERDFHCRYPWIAGLQVKRRFSHRLGERRVRIPIYGERRVLSPAKGGTS